MSECRARAHALGRPVYVVCDSEGDAIGVRVPRYVLQSIIWQEAVENENEETEKERGEGSSNGDVDDESASLLRKDTYPEFCVISSDGEGEGEEYGEGDGMFPDGEASFTLSMSVVSYSDSNDDDDFGFGSEEKFAARKAGLGGKYGDDDGDDGDDDEFSDEKSTCGHAHGSSFWDEM